jgi:hypothetical protein
MTNKPSEPETVQPRSADDLDANTLPRQTTPTWDMELLISGATVFALLQLPAVLDSALYEYFPRFGREMSVMLLLTYIYSKASVIVLIVTFIAHLALRGYWVALVGLRSVHPAGIRWEKLKMGPIVGALVKRRYASIDDIVERSDNRATKVFGLGIGFALIMITPLAFVILLYGLAFALSYVFDGRLHWNTLFLLLMALLIVPFVLLTTVDKMLGAKIRANGCFGRAIGAALRFYTTIGFGRINNLPITLYYSHVGSGRGTAITMVAMTLVFVLVFAQLLRDTGEWRTGNYRFVPSASADAVGAVRAEYYASLRAAGAPLKSTPFIQADIVRDPYLRVFVPYEPARHNYWLEQDCPAAKGDAEDAAARAQRDLGVLACLGRINSIALDGQPIADPQFHYYTDPNTGLSGMVSMISVRELDRGRHELVIKRTPRVPHDNNADEPLPDFRIPFWL